MFIKSTVDAIHGKQTITMNNYYEL